MVETDRRLLLSVIFLHCSLLASAATPPPPPVTPLPYSLPFVRNSTTATGVAGNDDEYPRSQKKSSGKICGYRGITMAVLLGNGAASAR